MVEAPERPTMRCAAAIRAGLRSAQHGKRVDVLFVLLGIGFVAVVFKIGEERALHRRGCEIVRAKRLIQSESDSVDAFGFERTQDGAAEFAKFGGIEAIALAAAREHQAFGAESRGVMQDGDFQRLARELARVVKLLDLDGGGAIGRRAFEPDND